MKCFRYVDPKVYMKYDFKTYRKTLDFKKFKDKLRNWTSIIFCVRTVT